MGWKRWVMAGAMLASATAYAAQAEGVLEQATDGGTGGAGQYGMDDAGTGGAGEFGGAADAGMGGSGEHGGAADAGMGGSGEYGGAADAGMGGSGEYGATDAGTGGSGEFGGATDSGVGGAGEMGTGMTPEQQEELAMPSEWNKPSRLLTQARTEVSQKPDQAARHLNEVADELQRHSKEAKGQTRTDLSQASQSLKSVAEQLRTNPDQFNPTSLDQPYAQAFTSLAAWYQDRAEEHWTKKSAQDAGEALRASAHYLERGAEAAGKGTDKGLQATVRESRRVAGDLLEGTGFVPKAVGDAIASVGRDVQKLGRDVKPSRAGRRPPPSQ